MKQIGTLKEERKFCRTTAGSERISPSRSGGVCASQSAAGFRKGDGKRKFEAFEFNNIKKDLEAIGKVNNENSRPGFDTREDLLEKEVADCKKVLQEKLDLNAKGGRATADARH